MKLHSIPLFQSCGLSAVALLTGEPIKNVARRVLRIREKFPRDYDGYQCPKSKMMKSTEQTYLSELKRALAEKKIKLKRFVSFGGKAAKFAKEHPKGTFFLNFQRHVGVCKDGRFYDNCNIGAAPGYYRFHNDTIISFVKIKER